MIIDFSNVNGGGGGGGYTLPIASQSTLGGIKVGQNLTIDSGGTLSADAQAVSVATTATTGVVQVGSGLSITSGGVLSTDIDLSDYAEKSDLEDYATVDSLSGYVETSAMSGYQTTDAMSGYVETTAMSGYQTTQAMSAYQTTQGMSGYVPTTQIATIYNNGLVRKSSNGKIKVAQTENGIGHIGDMYMRADDAAPTSWAWFEYWVDVDDNGWFIHLDQKELESVSGSLETEEMKCNNGESDFNGKTFNVIMGWGIRLGIYDDAYYYLSLGWYDDNLYFIQYLGNKGDGYEVYNAVQIDWEGFSMDLTYDTFVEKEDDGIIKVYTESQRCLEPFNWYGIGSNGGGGGKATTYDWGSVLLGNGIGLEVNDNVIFGVSAGENYVFGNGEGVGYDPNNSRGGGMKAPLPSAYTQYNLDIYDDYSNCIDFVNGGGNINLSLYIDGQNGNVVLFDCDGTRYIKIYCSSGVYYLEAYAKNQRGAKSLAPTTATTIEFNTTSPYKDFMIHYDGSGKIEVYESYDNYNTPIAELSDVDFGETISHIQLFDNTISMNQTGIGTISINDTDYIKPYYEYDGNTVSNVGFVLRKRSYIDPSL